MTWSYVPTRLASTPLYQARLLVGDTLQKDPQFQDEELNWLMSLRGSVYGAAAEACRSLSAQMSRQADTVQGEMHVLYSSRAKAYAQRALEYESKARVRSGGAMPYAGGISESDKSRAETDEDRVMPQYELGMDDNFLPVPSVQREGT